MAFALAVQVSPDAVTLSPGASAEVSARITNLSDVEQDYQVEVVGLPGAGRWSSDERPLTLRPRTSGSLRLRILLGEEGAAERGPHRLAVLVTSPSQPSVSRAAELHLEVAETSGVTMTAAPLRAQGRGRSSHWLTVRNDSGSDLALRLVAAAEQSRAQVTVTPPRLHLPVAGVGEARVDVVGGGVLAGRRGRSAISIRAESGGQVRGQVRLGPVQQPRAVPRGLVSALAVVLVAAVLAGSAVAGASLGRRTADSPTSGAATGAEPSTRVGGGQDGSATATGTPRLTTTDCPPSGSTGERRLQPDTLLVLRCVHRDFPGIKIFYGWRPDPLPDHPSGRAVDIMVPQSDQPAGLRYGNRIAFYLQQNAAAFGVDYVIWQQHIWSVQRRAEGWRLMADRGGLTANHRDHVHVTTLGSSGQGAGVTVPDREGDAPTAPPTSAGETADPGEPTAEAPPGAEMGGGPGESPTPDLTPTPTPGSTPTPDPTATPETSPTPGATPG